MHPIIHADSPPPHAVPEHTCSWTLRDAAGALVLLPLFHMTWLPAEKPHWGPWHGCSVLHLTYYVSPWLLAASPNEATCLAGGFWRVPHSLWIREDGGAARSPGRSQAAGPGCHAEHPTWRSIQQVPSRMSLSPIMTPQCLLTGTQGPSINSPERLKGPFHTLHFIWDDRPSTTIYSWEMAKFPIW